MIETVTGAIANLSGRSDVLSTKPPSPYALVGDSIEEPDDDP
jgi:hypothetical protein